MPSTDGAPNRRLTTEELLLLWVANQNPAFMRYDDLFDDHELAMTTDYPRVVAAIRKQSAKEAARADGLDLVERLLEPARQSPDSLGGQLRWMRDHWSDIVDDDLLARLTWSLDVLRRSRSPPSAHGPATMAVAADIVESAALAGFGGQEEPESFSQDLDWMPGLVLMAKSTYVWLDQLSRTLWPCHPDPGWHPRRGAGPAARLGLHRPVAHRPLGAQQCVPAHQADPGQPGRGRLCVLAHGLPHRRRPGWRGRLARPA